MEGKAELIFTAFAATIIVFIVVLPQVRRASGRIVAMIEGD